MKRKNNLFPILVSFKNLHAAFKKAYKGCHRSYEAMRFNFFMEQELARLQKELIEGIYRPNGYRVFKIHDPKERLISVAPFRDRVVHHALVNVLEPIYEKTFISDSYATRKGKGTHKSIHQIQKFMRQTQWYLRTDVKKYFDTIQHDILLRTIKRKIKDHRLLFVIQTIIRSIPGDKGMPIGNLTSQFLANVYLDPLDHFIKEQLKIKHYVRYMDDFVILENCPNTLKHQIGIVQQFLSEELQLELKPSSTFIQPKQHGLSMLGARIYPNYIRVLPKTLTRSSRRIKGRFRQFNQGAITEEQLADSLTSMFGHLDFFDAYQLRCAMGQANYKR